MAVRAWHMGMSVLLPLEMLSATDTSTLGCLFEGFSFPVIPSLLILKIDAWTFWSGCLTAASFINAIDKAQPWAQRTWEPSAQVLQKSSSAKVHSDGSLLLRAITSGIGVSSGWSLMPRSQGKKVDAWCHLVSANTSWNPVLTDRDVTVKTLKSHRHRRFYISQQ